MFIKMATLQRLSFLLSTLVISHPSAVHSQSPITCVAGVYTTGEKANVTCLFNEDITTGKNKEVYISRRAFDASRQTEGKEVLKCSFTGNTVSLCEAEDGYRFVDFQKSSLKMEISDVSENFQGSYTCNVIPSDESAIQRTTHACILLVNGAHTTTQAGERKCENGCSAVYVNMALLIILLLAVILIFMFVGFKKNWFSFSKVASRFSRRENDDAEQGAHAEETVPLNQTIEQEATATHNTNPPSPVSSPAPTCSSSPGPTPGADGKQHEEETREGRHIEEAAGVAENVGAENQSQSRDESRAPTKRSCVVQ